MGTFSKPSEQLKGEMVKSHHKAKEPKDVEAAVETETVSGGGNNSEKWIFIRVEQPKSLKKTICFFVTALLAIFALSFIVSFFLIRALAFNPNPHRFVHLNKTNGSYGLIMDVRVITEVIPGGAADLDGKIKKGDTIKSINGVSLKLGALRAETVTELIDTRDSNVDLAVVSKYEVPTSDCILCSLLISWTMAMIAILIYISIGDCIKKEVYKREEETKTANALKRMDETLKSLEKQIGDGRKEMVASQEERGMTLNMQD